MNRTIKVYLNDELINIIENDNELLMVEIFDELTRALEKFIAVITKYQLIMEQYNYNYGYDAKVELYDENDKIIKGIVI